MYLIDKLKKIWKSHSHPVLIHKAGSFSFNDILKEANVDFSEITQGKVVALIGDYDPFTISNFFKLIDLNTIIVPLTIETKTNHNLLFEIACVDIIISNGIVKKRNHSNKSKLIEILRKKNSPGLIAFTSGTTGEPKAILHDFSIFLKRFETPRPSLRTINFLMFDHVGGLNTLFHTLFNKGTVIVPENRSVNSILTACEKFQAEVLPTTPTFLRMMLISGLIPESLPDSIKVITYGSEKMDKHTLNELCCLLPHIDFRQTYGTSELGVVRVKSESRNSLYIKIGDIGLETKIEKNILYLRSKNRMLGYLNASSPFDEYGWYNTNDVVKVRNGYLKIIGRIGDVINVGGLKFISSEVEKIAIKYQNIEFVKIYSVPNPISGNHVEIKIQITENSQFDIDDYKKFMKKNLPKHMVPQKCIVGKIEIGNRFKRI